MTTQTIPVSELKIGMYIVLNLPWYAHPFLRNEFIISSEDEIKKIRGLGLKTLLIEPAKSKIPAALEAIVDAPANGETETIKPGTSIVPDELLAVIRDIHLPPEKKARLMQQHSITMMKNLLGSPTAGNIKAVKKGMSEIVDLILRDDKTTFYLINITDHDYYTYTHSVNVGFLAIALAKQLFRHSDDHDLHALGAGFFLHDLGKVKITLDIINKPGRLTDEEMKEMKRHPSLGFFLLQEVKQMTKELKMIVLQHHEKMNGTGYPMGIRSEDIHVYGRICAIADIFDALTSKRPYKNQMPSFVALKLMRDEMVPHHINKELFEKFIPLFKSP
jgi:HD-GYP domain-containing protein (c-di-GMP phosphodiesterase class II)